MCINSNDKCFGFNGSQCSTIAPSKYFEYFYPCQPTCSHKCLGYLDKATLPNKQTNKTSNQHNEKTNKQTKTETETKNTP